MPLKSIYICDNPKCKHRGIKVIKDDSYDLKLLCGQCGAPLIWVKPYDLVQTKLGSE